MIESFLTLHYNFVAPRSEEERYFRYYAWCIKDLIRKREYRPITQWGRERHEGILKDLDQFRNRIGRNAHFEKLSEKQRRIIIEEGEWPLWDSDTGKRLSWDKLAVSAGFDRSHFRQFYSAACGYSHSSYWSIVQVNSVSSGEEEKMICAGTISFLEIIMAFMIKSCGILYPEFKIMVEKDSDICDLLDVLCAIGGKP